MCLMLDLLQVQSDEEQRQVFQDPRHRYTYKASSKSKEAQSQAFCVLKWVEHSQMGFHIWIWADILKIPRMDSHFSRQEG